MPSLSRSITAIRVGIVILAGGVASATVLYLASMPPPPPESDGFAHGMAAIIGGGVILISLGLATSVIITPTLVGRTDPLGFNHWQRRALQAAGGLIGLGVVLALVSGLDGLVPLIALLVLAFGIVSAILIWRFGEIVARRRTRTEVTE